LRKVEEKRGFDLVLVGGGLGAGRWLRSWNEHDQAEKYEYSGGNEDSLE